MAVNASAICDISVSNRARGKFDDISAVAFEIENRVFAFGVRIPKRGKHSESFACYVYELAPVLEIFQYATA